MRFESQVYQRSIPLVVSTGDDDNDDACVQVITADDDVAVAVVAS